MVSIILKNILLHALIVIFYFFAQHEVGLIDPSKLETLLLFVGLIVIAPITSNFIYSYANANTKEALLWGHITTGLSMLVIGFLFCILDILLVEMLGNVLVFRASILLFWLAVITFDFADFTLKGK